MKSIKAVAVVAAIMIITAMSSCTKKAEVHLVSPANKSLNVPLNQVYTCSDVSSAVDYEFIFVDLNTSNYIGSQHLLVNSYTPALESGHSYRWHVVAHTTDGGTLYSDDWSVSVQ